MVPPLPSTEKDFLEGFPSPLSVGLVSSVGIGGAGDGELYFGTTENRWIAIEMGD